jgi:LmbE family N-acetylglucosaminyl deacetylase
MFSGLISKNAHSEKFRILVVSPHADDETIGLGGTISALVKEGHDISVAVLTGHGEKEPHPIWPRSEWIKIRKEAKAAMEVLGVKRLIFREIPAVRVCEEPIWRLNKLTSGLINEVKPDVLFVPFPYDLHRDHRELFHSFSVAWRPVSETGKGIREVFAYEVQSETHLNAPYLEPGFIPNVWIDISQTLKIKLEAVACYKSQVNAFPHSRSLRAIRALAEWRGAQIGVEAAEALVSIRRLM